MVALALHKKTSAMHRHILLALILCNALSNTHGQSHYPAPVFGNNGCVDFHMGDLAPGAEGITHVYQPDGKVIIGGWSFAPGNTMHLAMVRIDPLCGQLDSTFGTNGQLVTWFEQGKILRDLALQADGKILGCGRIRFPFFYEEAAVFRFNPDGSVDTSFNDGLGYLTLGVPGTASTWMAHRVLVDDEGLIHVFAISPPSYYTAFRILPDGTLDTSYGNNGRAQAAAPYMPYDGFASAELDTECRLVMAALVGTGPWDPYVLGLARFTVDGQPDNSFGMAGLIQFPERPVDYAASGGKAIELGLLSDSRIVVTYGHIVSSNYRVQLAAFNNDGSIDNTFGIDGLFTHPGGSAMAGGAEVLDDDHILLFHKHHWNNGPASMVKVTPTGELDPGFGNNGVLLAPFGPQPDYRGFQDGFLLDNGDLVAYGGKSYNSISVARFTTDPVADALPVISFNYPDLVCSGSGTFQWFLDGVEIPGATGNSHTPASNGVYTVTMELESCSFTSPPYTMLTTGVEEWNSAALRLLNNPAEELLLLDNPGGAIPWEILDLRGALILQGTLRHGRNSIPVASLRPGPYLLRGADGQPPLRFVKW